MLTTWPKVFSPTTPGELPQLQEFRDEPRSEPALPSVVTACLGERLRAHYAQLVKEPVPDELLRILEALNRTGRAGNDR